MVSVVKCRSSCIYCKYLDQHKTNLSIYKLEEVTKWSRCHIVSIAFHMPCMVIFRRHSINDYRRCYVTPTKLCLNWTAVLVWLTKIVTILLLVSNSTRWSLEIVLLLLGNRNTVDHPTMSLGGEEDHYRPFPNKRGDYHGKSSHGGHQPCVISQLWWLG